MPGAGGINAARAVIAAPADGYTMGFVTNGTAISVDAFKHLPFDPVKQFAMVAGLGQFNLLFAVNANSKYKTLGDFIKDAKAHPGQAQHWHDRRRRHAKSRRRIVQIDGRLECADRAIPPTRRMW